MKNSAKKLKYYDAAGLVEALIAILIAGICSIVLLAIAAQSIQALLEAEQVDSLTQAAVEGAQMAQIIVDKEKSEEQPVGTYFPPVLKYANFCVPLKGDTTDPYIPKIQNTATGFGPKMPDNPSSRGQFETEGKVESEKYGDNVFRVLCFNSGIPSVTAPRYVVVTVKTGLINCRTRKDNPEACRVSDVSYRAIINL